jgi:hypothetical protein
MGLPLLVYLELITYATVKIVNGDARGLWIEWLTLSILLRLLNKPAPLPNKKKR